MNVSGTVLAQQGGRVRAWLQLLRLPNVFTSMADILMGYFVTHGSVEDGVALALLLGSSSALYLAGMVLNDLFDFEVDSLERPHRPLPSGRIHASTARWLGTVLLAGGVVLAWLVSWRIGAARPAVVATLLAALVVAYDASLKRTPLGPLAMGGCRALNVLLGMSAAAFAWQEVNYLVALGVGIYITGVTWFARREAEHSPRGQLGLAIVVLLGGIGVLACYPLAVNEQTAEVMRPVFAPAERYWLLMLMLGLLVAMRTGQALVSPTPARVQQVVKYCLMTLVVLDAAVCVAVRGLPAAAVILALLAPMTVLGWWIYST